MIDSYFSDRIRNVRTSPTLGISSRAREMKREGIDVISLSSGEPDYPTFDYIKREAERALRDNFTHYTPTPGMPELREAIVSKFKRDQGLEYSAREVITTTGAKQALYEGFQVICQEGDEVLMPVPYWVSYPQQVIMAGGTTVPVATSEKNNFKMTPEELKEAITPSSKVLLLNYPHNPTGHLYSAQELKALVPLIIEHDLLLVTDEVYEHLTYEEPMQSIVALAPELQKRTLIINGLSKAYAMTGWRVGYAAGPEPLISAMSRMQSHLTSNITSISQRAAVAALEGPMDQVEEMRDEFRLRRDLMVEGINSLEGFSCSKPAGTFYLWVSIGDYLKQSPYSNDSELAEALLEKGRVATVPGSAFGQEGYLRLSFASSRERLQAALGRLEQFVG